jgi:serine/threonine protein kinase
MEPQFAGRYRLGVELGRDALGELRVGVDAEGREFACKRLRVDVSGRGEAVQRFRREQSVLIGLASANLVTLHDLVVDDQGAVLILDLVHGGSLRERLSSSGTVLPKEIARIGSGVASALQTVHEAGVVHGDVRPENIRMDDSGAVRVPKLAEAGVFRIAPPPEQTSMRSASKYVAPEVAAGSEPTPAADLYALGVVIYELYCGIAPFPGGYVRREDEEPGRPGDMPDPLWEVVRVLLAVDPLTRPPADRIARVLHEIVPDLVNSAVGPKLTRPPSPTTAAQRKGNAGALPPPEIGDTLFGTSFTSPPPSPRRRKKLVPVLIGVALVAGVIIALTSAGSSSTQVASHPAPSASAALPVPSSAESVSPTSAAPTVAPNLIGKKLSDAQDELGSGIQIETVNSIERTAEPNTVIDQDPKAGAALNGHIRLTVAQPAIEAYLNEMQPLSGGSWSNTNQPGNVAGKSYLHTVSRNVDPCRDTGSVEYNISKGYRRLVASTGMDDNSGDSGLKVQVEIFGDGRKLESVNLEVGKMSPVDVDLSGVLRIKFDWQVVNPNCSGNGSDAFDLGEATLLGLPGEVPSPTATTN